MRTAPVVALLPLAVAAPSAAARPAISVGPSDLEPATPVTVALKAPGGFAAAANRIRFTIRQQRHDASCLSVASVTVKPNRARTGAHATVRPAKPWCSGEGKAEARVLDRHGTQLGSAVVTLLTVAPAADETRPVKVSVLDGSTINGTPASGDLSGVVAARPSIASATTVDGLAGGIGPCRVGLGSALVLMGDGVVFGNLHTDCAGTLLLAGRAGDAGLNSVALDSFPGSAAAHLLVKVDLSSLRSTRAARG